MRRDVTSPITRAVCTGMDTEDPIAWLRDRFPIPNPDRIYLDGNSLGRPSQHTIDRLDHTIRVDWADGLVESWSDWIELPERVGDELGAAFLGAGPGQVVVCDGITVNLYKVIKAALALRPDRTTIVYDPDDFPSDRYILAAVAAECGCTLRAVASDIDEGLSGSALDAALDDDVALVCLSLVAYRSGALLDLTAVTARVHDAGALMVWDLAHAVGAVDIALDAADVDFAVGCTYKYLNAGPGSTGFVHAARRLLPELVNPIQGWMAQAEPFAMRDRFDPAPGIRRFLSGTPAILGVVATQAGVATLAEAGIDALRAKSLALCELLVSLQYQVLEPLGFRLASPTQADRRGSHVTLEHPRALAISQAMRRRGVIPDFRVPDRLRLGLAPAYTRFVDVWDAVAVIQSVIASGEHLVDVEAGTVT